MYDSTNPESDAERRSGDRPKKKAGKSIGLRGLIAAMGILFLLMAGLLLLAGTGPVLRLALPAVQKMVGKAIDGSLAVEQLGGSLWTGLTVDSLTLAIPATGLSLEGRRMELQWSPLALVRGVLQVDRLAAEHLTASLPHSPGPEAPPEEPAGGPPAVPLSFRLKALDLPRIDIADPKSGRSFSYSLSAAGAAGQRAAELSLRLAPLGEERDRLHAELAFDAGRRELRAEIDGRLDRTGLVMTLAGLPPEEATDVGITLKGEGPADAWQGRLQVTAADLAELGGSLGLQLDQRQLGFTFSGAARTLGGLAAQVPEQLQGTAEIGLAGRYEMAVERLALSKIGLRKDGLLDLAATADLDLSAKRLKGELQAKLPAAASGLIGGAAEWEELELSGRAEGDLALPDLELTLAGRSVVTQSVSSRELSLTLRSAARGDRLAVAAKGEAHGNDWSADGLENLLGERLNIAVDADVARDFGEISIDRLAAEATGLQLTGRGRIGAEGAINAADLAADIADLAVLAELAGMELHGAARVALEDAAWTPSGGGRAAVSIAGRDLALGLAELDRIAGPRPELAGHLELTPAGDLAVQLDRVDLAMTDGDLSLAFADGFTRLRLAADLEVLPGALPPGAGLALSEPARLAVRLEGPTEAPEGEITLTVPSLTAGGEQFESLKTATSLRWSDEAVLSLANRADFTLRKKPYRLEADLALPPDRLRLSRLLLTGEGLELSGQLELPGYTPPMRGTIELNGLEARLLQDWQAPLAAGRVSGTVAFLPEQAAQRLDIDLTARGVRLAGARPHSDGLERLSLRGRIADAFRQPSLELQLQGEKIAYDTTHLSRLQAGLNGPLAGLRATLEAEGQLQAREPLPLSLTGSADLNLAGEMRVEVGRLTAGIGTEEITLHRPLLLERSAAGELRGSAALALGARGRAEGSWRLTPGEDLSARVKLTTIALGPWDEMFTHRGAGGDLSLSATLREERGKAAQAQFSASLEEIRFARATRAGTTASPQLPPLAARLEAGLENGRLNGNLSLGGAEQQILTAEVALPVTVSLLGGQYELAPRSPLSVSAKVDGEISQFWPYLPLPDHSLAGRLRLAATLSGSVAQPELEGTVELADGRYEHLQFGTLLQDIRIQGSLDSRGLHLPEIAATDGGRGTLSGRADIEIGGRPFLAYNTELAMREMALTRMDEMQLNGDIDLHITGDDRAGALRGEVKVNRGEVDLAVAFPPSVPQLEVENLPQPGDREGGGERDNRAAQKKEDEAESFSTELELTVDIPGRLFVRGKGLDSEWGGRLDITGTAEAPQLVGELRARRGQLDLIGKTFVIRDSQITFLGGQPPDPQLEIVGVHTAGDFEVRASLSGTASETKLALSSEPQLPQDEILSRILFGKSQGKLSAYEAVQLAGVAADLSGTGGGFDIMGTLRKILRVDVLRVEGGEDGPNVEVGKYLKEGVYVGTKRGATSDSSAVEVEIELTPHIKATSETNEIDNKTGVQFKWDY